MLNTDDQSAPRLEVSLGLWLDRPPEEVVATALIADALGYSKVWIGEMATWDAFALGTHIGKMLQHANLMIGPLAVSVRDPAMIAMGIASVAALTGREVGVALGTSSVTVVENWHGRSRSGSGKALAESAQVVRTLLNGDKADFRGEQVSSVGYRLRLDPPKSEVAIAAFGDQAVRTAARLGDRLVLNLVDPLTVEDITGKLRKAAAEFDRPVPRVAVWVRCAIDPSDRAMEQMSHGVVGYLGAPGYSEMLTRAGFGDLVSYARSKPHPAELLARVPPSLAAVTGLIGDADQVRTRIDEYISAGANDIVIAPSATDDDPAAENTLRVMAALHDKWM